MRNARHLPFGLTLALVLLLSGCGLYCTTETYTYIDFEPIYLSEDEILKLETLGPQPLRNPGKLYLHGDYLLINEVDEGVHIIDNGDPTNPTFLSFVSIPGNKDILVKEGADGPVLYADNYMHLLSLDLSNPLDVPLIKRVENVFQSFYPEGNAKGEILVGYKEVERTGRSRECPSWSWGAQPDSSPPPATPVPDTGSPSQGGSLARFASLDNFLYTIDGSSVQTFNVAEPANPQVFNRVNVDFGIETLFPYTGGESAQLYIGGQNGMYIYDAADPANLKRQGAISHIQSCDPVVVQGDLAYVTLQGSCFNQQNRLEIIDVSDPTAPSVLTEYALQEPFGLGVDGDYLFICDGVAGLKVYGNARDPDGLTLLKQFGEVRARDIIPYNDHAIVIAENGFYQYDYSALPEGDIQLLSSIPVEDEP